MRYLVFLLLPLSPMALNAGQTTTEEAAEILGKGQIVDLEVYERDGRLRAERAEFFVRYEGRFYICDIEVFSGGLVTRCKFQGS